MWRLRRSPPTEKLHPVVLRPGRVINLSLPVFDELWIIDGRQFYHRPPMLNFLLKSPDPPPSTGSSETVRLDGATRIKLVRSSSRLWVEWALCKSDRHRTVYESNKGWPVTDDRRPPPGESMNYRDSRVALSRWSTRLTPSWLWPCAVHYVYTSTLSMITMCSAYLIWYNHCWCYYYHYSICGNDASITTTTKATTSTTTTITTTASTVVFIIIFFYRVYLWPHVVYTISGNLIRRLGRHVA